MLKEWQINNCNSGIQHQSKKLWTLTSVNSIAAIRSLMNLRTRARYRFPFGCLLKYSNIQYRRLLLESLLTTLVVMFTEDAMPSSSPAERGRGSPQRKAFTYIYNKMNIRTSQNVLAILIMHTLLRLKATCCRINSLTW